MRTKSDTLPSSADTTSEGHFDTIDDAIEQIAAGRAVVVVDDENRENEGDLIMAAAAATPESMAFMIRHTCGIACVPISPAAARRLHLPPMTTNNEAPLATAFTVSVDHRAHLTTGISAFERAHTVRALADPDAQPDDFVRPGHVFPLIARDGGVLIRSGHTEAAVDLATLAGMSPAGVICELVNDDGSVKKGADVAAFARNYGLVLISINDLIAWRQRRETLITRDALTILETPIGPAKHYIYSALSDGLRHFALVFGDPKPDMPVLARLHCENSGFDVFHRNQGILGPTLQRIQQEGAGVIVYLREGASGVVPGSAYQSAKTSPPHQEAQWREIGIGAQILRDIGIRSIRLLATRERQYIGLSGFGVDIAETQIMTIDPPKPE